MARYIDAEKIKYTKFIPENDPFDGAGGLCALARKAVATTAIGQAESGTRGRMIFAMAAV